MRKVTLFITGLFALLSASAAEDAKVVLQIDIPNATYGYQLLLDKDASTYNNLFFDTSTAYYNSSFADFEYTIPENAEPSPATSNSLLTGSASVNLPAGTYDMMVLHVAPMGMGSSGLPFVWGFSRVDNLDIAAGHTYTVKIRERDGLQGRGQYADFFPDIDISVEELVLPADRIDLGANEQIGITIRNNGKSPAAGITISYTLNDSQPVIQTLDDSLAPDESKTFTFSTTADLSLKGKYAITGSADFPGDLYKGNNTLTGIIRHLEARELPFSYTFMEHGPTGFADDWITVDANNDGFSWEYGEWNMNPSGGMGTAQVNGVYVGDMTADDYLFTPPLDMQQGEASIQLSIAASYNEQVTETVEVFIGTSTDINDLRSIGTLSAKGPNWVRTLLNFNVEADGAHFLAFRYNMTGGSQFKIDDILIDRGHVAAAPVLDVSRIILPVSGCDLPSDAPIALEITNTGTGESSEMEFTISLSHNGSDSRTFTEKVNAVIPPNSSGRVTLTNTIDLSALGDYTVTVSGSFGESEIAPTSATVSNITPMSLPFTTNFWENDTNGWAQATPGTWQYDAYGTFLFTQDMGLENALVAYGFKAQNAVRVKLAYSGSYPGNGHISVRLGLAGSDFADYKEIYSDSNYMDTKQIEFQTAVDQPGNYRLIIINGSTMETVESLRLYEITVSEVFIHDVRVNGVTSGMSLLTPADQLKGTIEVVVDVENRGSQPVTAGASLSSDNIGFSFNSAEPRLIAPGETAKLTTSFTPTELNVGDRINITAHANLSGSVDEYLADNTYEIGAVTVTESLRATENESEILTGVGDYAAGLKIGNLFRLSAEDIMTGIQLGLAPANGNTMVAQSAIGIGVYEASSTDETVGRQLFYTEMTRGDGANFVTIDTDPMLLAPGEYFVEVTQLSINNMGLGYLSGRGLYCYQNLDGRLIRTTNDMALMVRGIFEEKTAPATDVALTALLSPARDKVLFSDNQNIDISVRNLGYKEASSTITLNVNGLDISTSTVNMLTYESKNITLGIIDMSHAGEYILTVSSLTKDDEQPNNDILTKSFTAAEEADPYTLDFESCNNFDGPNDILNPRWSSVNRINREHNSFWMFNYPYKNQGGFIAFNPEAADPTVNEENLPGFFPHSGSRFGAAFCVTEDYNTSEREQTDTWLISPKLQLGDNSKLELWVKSRAPEYANVFENFQILISETNSDFDSFSIIGSNKREAPFDWTLIEEDLSAYDNKAVYVAIRYIGFPLENIVFMVDDIHIDTTLSLDAPATSDDIIISYNPDEQSIDIHSDSQLYEVTLANISGQTLVLHPLASVHQFSTATLIQGIYIVKAVSESNVAVRKILVR